MVLCDVALTVPEHKKKRVLACMLGCIIILNNFISCYRFCSNNLLLSVIVYFRENPLRFVSVCENNQVIMSTEKDTLQWNVQLCVMKSLHQTTMQYIHGIHSIGYPHNANNRGQSVLPAALGWVLCRVCSSQPSCIQYTDAFCSVQFVGTSFCPEHFFFLKIYCLDTA